MTKSLSLPGTFLFLSDLLPGHFAPLADGPGASATELELLPFSFISIEVTDPVPSS